MYLVANMRGELTALGAAHNEGWFVCLPFSRCATKGDGLETLGQLHERYQPAQTTKRNVELGSLSTFL